MKHIKSFLPYVLSMLLISVLSLSCSTDTDTNEDPMEDTDNMDNVDDVDDTTDSSDTNSINDITGILELFVGTGLSYEVTDSNVIFTTADLPNHTSPYWDAANDLYEAYNGDNANFNLNPNQISEQNIVLTIPLNPSAASTNEATRLGPIGISRNGVVFFNQYAGPNNQPLTGEINSFDQYLGHPTGSDMYHYHIEPSFLTNEFGAEAFLGLLSDGFPVYGPMENGVAVTNSDLDDFHGHTGATTEFPNGIYHYHITDADPYLNGNGYYGIPGNISN